MSQLSLFNQPEEIQHYTLNYLTAKELYNLCVSSESNKKKVQSLSQNFTLRIKSNNFGDTTEIKYFLESKIRVDIDCAPPYMHRTEFRINAPSYRVWFYLNETEKMEITFFNCTYNRHIREEEEEERERREMEEEKKRETFYYRENKKENNKEKNENKKEEKKKEEKENFRIISRIISRTIIPIKIARSRKINHKCKRRLSMYY